MKEIRMKRSELREAIAINDSLGTVWSLGENYNNLGTQYFYAGEYKKGLAALDTAMVYARKINAKELITDNYRYGLRGSTKRWATIRMPMQI